MTGLTDIYRPSMALLTDLYQLTMACGYWKQGRLDDEAVFALTFRSHPFDGGYTVAAGLEYAIDFLNHFRFAEDDLAYLATLTSDDGSRLLPDAFLDYLRSMTFACDVDAMPEGTVCFPHEPLIRVKGPILQAQLLETPLLNLINFQTLVATKAARITAAAAGDPVLEFGLRRAQGVDGGLTVARATYIGGCPATSNVLGGKLFDIPVKGTHAHSWVMSYASELDAFEGWAEAMPHNSILLVDTYDTREGVKRAIEVGQRLRERGHALAGVRLDSGDLTYLSQEARRMLDEAGFEDTKIVASGDLDEHVIHDLKQQGARIDIWGVGTKLATAYDDPALGGIYKLAALREPGGDWRYKLKLSEQTAKTSDPGILQVRRYRENGRFLGDMIYNEPDGAPVEPEIVDPTDPNRTKTFSADAEHEDLLAPIFRGGRCVYESPDLSSMRKRTAAQLEHLHPAIRRLLNPHEYPAGLAAPLHEMKSRLIREARRRKGAPAAS